MAFMSEPNMQEVLSRLPDFAAGGPASSRDNEDTTFLVRLGVLSTAAKLITLSYYCTPKDFEKLNWGACDNVFPDLESACFNTINTYFTCMGALTRKYGILFVAFRGTMNMKDVQTDAQAQLVTIDTLTTREVAPDESKDPPTQAVRVHQGFVSKFLETLYEKKCEDICAFVTEEVSTHFKILAEELKYVVFCGHSLGGSLSVLAGVQWMKTRNKPAYNDLVTHQEKTPGLPRLKSFGSMQRGQSKELTAIPKLNLQRIPAVVINVGAVAVGNRAFQEYAQDTPMLEFKNGGDGIAWGLEWGDPTNAGVQAAVLPFELKQDKQQKYKQQKNPTYVESRENQSDQKVWSEYRENPSRSWLTRDFTTVSLLGTWGKDTATFLTACDSRSYAISTFCKPSFSGKKVRDPPNKRLYDRYTAHSTQPYIDWFERTETPPYGEFQLKQLWKYGENHDVYRYEKGILQRVTQACLQFRKIQEFRSAQEVQSKSESDIPPTAE
jgi:Lipase (class 3)